MVKNSKSQEGRDGGRDLSQNHEAVINAINYPLQGFVLGIGKDLKKKMTLSSTSQNLQKHSPQSLA